MARKPRDADRDMWESTNWKELRGKCDRLRRWYDGIPLDETQPHRRRKDGKLVERYPLRVNLWGVHANVHADLVRGMPVNDDPLIVRAIVERTDEVTSDHANVLEDRINNKVWRASNGGPIQQEGLLSMNIYGGCAYKLAFEPWMRDLPYGLGIRLISNPSLIWFEVDHLQPWRMLSCWFGYEISPQIALLKYGVSTDSKEKPVLYMEHWTPDEWRVRVDGKVPQMKMSDGEPVPLKGKNPWGFVPFYYIPHARSSRVLGDSPIENTDGMVTEVNSRATTISDLVQHTRPGVLYGTDIRGTPRAFPLTIEGQHVGYIIHLGDTPPMSNAKPPSITAPPISNIPEGIANWPRMLLDYWMIMARISPATFGLDNTMSGRITGPAVAQRMWTSVSHATTERINFSTAKTLMDKDILFALARLEGKSTGVEENDWTVGIRQEWPPMIPLDRTEHHKEVIERIQQKAISPEHYLPEFGVANVEEEKDNILDWYERMAEIEAKSQPTMFGGEGQDDRGQSEGQAVQRRGGTDGDTRRVRQT